MKNGLSGKREAEALENGKLKVGENEQRRKAEKLVDKEQILFLAGRGCDSCASSSSSLFAATSLHLAVFSLFSSSLT